MTSQRVKRGLTMAECQRQVRDFLEERDWLPRNPEMRYSALLHMLEEMGELSRCMTHLESRRAEVQRKRRARVVGISELEGELGDIFWHVLKIAEAYGVQVDRAFARAISKNRAKFPLNRFRARAARSR